MTVVQTGDALPGEVLVQSDQRGDDGATGDTVRGDNGAAPRCHIRQQLVDRRAGTLGDSPEILAVSSPSNVFAGRERRVLLGKLLSHVTGSHPLPQPGVDLAQPFVVTHRNAHQRRERASGVGGALEVAADYDRRAVCRERGSGAVSLLSAPVGQGGVELALPDAAGVVVGLAVTPDDQGCPPFLAPMSEGEVDGRAVLPETLELVVVPL